MRAVHRKWIMGRYPSRKESRKRTNAFRCYQKKSWSFTISVMLTLTLDTDRIVDKPTTNNCCFVQGKTTPWLSSVTLTTDWTASRNVFLSKFTVLRAWGEEEMGETVQIHCDGRPEAIFGGWQRREIYITQMRGMINMAADIATDPRAPGPQVKHSRLHDWNLFTHRGQRSIRQTRSNHWTSSRWPWPWQC